MTGFDQVLSLTCEEMKFVEDKAVEMCERLYHLEPDDKEFGGVWINNFDPYDPDDLLSLDEGYFIVHIDLPYERFEGKLIDSSITIPVPDRVFNYNRNGEWGFIMRMLYDYPESIWTLLDYVDISEA